MGAGLYILTPTLSAYVEPHKLNKRKPKMNFNTCKCNSKSEVLDSRLSNSQEGLPFIRRRRQCERCGLRFTTMEVVCDASKGVHAHLTLNHTAYVAAKDAAKTEIVKQVNDVLYCYKTKIGGVP